MQELDAAAQEIAHAHFVAMSDGEFLMDASVIPNQHNGGRYVVAPIDGHSNFAARIARPSMQGRNGYLVAALFPRQRPTYKGVLWTQNDIGIETLFARARLSIDRIPMLAAPIMHW